MFTFSSKVIKNFHYSIKEHLNSKKKRRKKTTTTTTTTTKGKKRKEKKRKNNWAPPEFEPAIYGLKRTHDPTTPLQLACKQVTKMCLYTDLQYKSRNKYLRILYLFLKT
jgi:hypothetical protein